MPNALAHVALLMVVPVALVLFGRLRPAPAAVAVFLAGLLVPPHGLDFDLPLIPPMDKESLAKVSILVVGAIYARERFGAARVDSRLGRMTWLIVLSMLVTNLLNDDAVRLGGVTKAGLTLHEAFSGFVRDALEYVLAFYLGRVFCRSLDDLEALLKVLVVSGMLYSVLGLYEMRMSPQLHRIVYGYHQNEWATAYRMGGWRPMIFMESGIALSMFFSITAIAAATLARVRVRAFERLSPRFVMYYLFFITLFCKSSATLVYTIVFVPLARVGRLVTLRRVVTIVAVLALLYPVLRSRDIWPTDAIVDAIRDYDPERAQSLEFRFDNEDAMLEHAAQRPWFGWGRAGRNALYDEFGEHVSVLDAFWIIVLSGRGYAGFLAIFLAILTPLWRARAVIARLRDERGRVLLGGMCMMIAERVVDLMFNGMYTTFTLFMAGGVAGVVAQLTRDGATSDRGGPRR